MRLISPRCSALTLAVAGVLVLAACSDGFSPQVIEETDFATALQIDLSAMTKTASGLYIETVSEGPAAVGSEYKSTDSMMGKEFKNDIRITEMNPPGRLVFVANDGKDDFTQEFTFDASGGGTQLTRKVNGQVPMIMSIMIKLMLGPMFANPSAMKGLKALKAKLEEGVS